jgi:hypothetical protein
MHQATLSCTACRFVKDTEEPAYGAFSRMEWKGNPFWDASRDARYATVSRVGPSTEKP